MTSSNTPNKALADARRVAFLKFLAIHAQVQFALISDLATHGGEAAFTGESFNDLLEHLGMSLKIQKTAFDSLASIIDEE